MKSALGFSLAGYDEQNYVVQYRSPPLAACRVLVLPAGPPLLEPESMGKSRLLHTAPHPALRRDGYASTMQWGTFAPRGRPAMPQRAKLARRLAEKACGSRKDVSVLPDVSLFFG